MCVLVEEEGRCVCVSGGGKVCVVFEKKFLLYSHVHHICVLIPLPIPLSPSPHILISSHSPFSTPSHSHMQWPAAGVSSDQGPLW